MVGLDTNVLVRYLAQDDPLHSPRATALIERTLTTENPGFISTVVMAETAWVLQRTYRVTGPELALAVGRLLRSQTLVIQSELDVLTAMWALQRGQGSFTDVLIGALATRAGCTQTLSFDRKAQRLPGFGPI